MRLVVTGYSSSLATYTVDGGTISPHHTQDLGSLGSLSWLQKLGGDLYGCHEVVCMEGQEGGAVSRWKLDGEGRLQLQEWVSTGSREPAHLLVSREHSRVYTANYGGGSVSVLGMEEAALLGKTLQLHTYPEGPRDVSHPHQVVVYGDWVWVVDLGCDRIRHYTSRRTGTAGLDTVMETQVTPGSGPRHMALHPKLPLAFLLCELQNKVIVYRVNMETSELTQLDQVKLSSKDTDFGAEILVQGDFVYCTSRGSGVLVVYRIVLTGDTHTLARLQEVDLAGTWPRSLDIKGRLGAVIDQKGDTV